MANIRSRALREHSRFKDALNIPARHIVRGEVGKHVARLQEVLDKAAFSVTVNGIDLDWWESDASLKEHLNIFGDSFPLKCDGNFGYRTSWVLIAFKNLYGLYGPGVHPNPSPTVGQGTIAKLDECCVEFERQHFGYQWGRV